MISNTRTIFVPSIVINRLFLARLSDSIEYDIHELNRSAWEHIAALIRQEQVNLEARAPYLTREEKMKEMERAASQITYNHRPAYESLYTIDTADGKKQTFTFLREIISSTPLPVRVRALSISISHVDKRYLSVRMYIHQPTGVFDKAGCVISTDNAGKMAQSERDLSVLFQEFRTPYHSLFFVRFAPYAVQKAVSFFFASAVSTLIFRIIMNVAPSFSSVSINGTISLHLIAVFAWYMAFRAAFAYIYPYYRFSISNEDRMRRIIGIAVGVVLVVLTVLLATAVLWYVR